MGLVTQDDRIGEFCDLAPPELQIKTGRTGMSAPHKQNHKQKAQALHLGFLITFDPN